MPITVRYGPAGQLLQAAEESGRRRATQRKRDFAQQVIQNVRQDYRRQDQQELEARRLAEQQRQADMQAQMQQPRARPARAITRQSATPERAREELDTLKQRLAQRRSQTPTDAGTRTRGTPFAQAAAQQTRTTEDEGGYGAVEGEDGAITAVTGDRGAELLRAKSPSAYQQLAETSDTPEQYTQAFQGLRQTQAAQGGLTQMTQPEVSQGLSSKARSKLAYAQLIGLDQLPERQQQAIQQLVQDESVDAQQARIMMDRVAERIGGEDAEVPQTGMSPRQAAQFRVYEARDERDKLIEQSGIPLTSLKKPVEDFAIEARQAAKEQAQQVDESNLPWYLGEGGMTKEENRQQLLQQAEEKIAAFRRVKELNQKIASAIAGQPGGESPQPRQTQQTQQPDQNSDPLGIR